MNECWPNNYGSSVFFWLLVIDAYDVAKEAGIWSVEIIHRHDPGAPFCIGKEYIEIKMVTDSPLGPKPYRETVLKPKLRTNWLVH